MRTKDETSFLFLRNFHNGQSNTGTWEITDYHGRVLQHGSLGKLEKWLKASGYILACDYDFPNRYAYRPK